MTEGGRLIRDFANNIAQPCKRHKLTPRLNFDGIWSIECEKGCSYYTQDLRPHDIIVRYRATPL